MNEPPAGGYKKEVLFNWILERRAERERLNPGTVRPARVRKARGAAVDTSSVDLSKVADAAQALTQLSASRADAYETWLEVGMALSELGVLGLHMWDQWSRQSTKYDSLACGEKWPTFTPGDGVTLATLMYYAQEDSAGTAVSTCSSCKEKDALIETQRIRIQALEDKYEQVRSHNQQQTAIQTSHTVEAASKRDTVALVHTELKRAERDEDGYAPFPVSYVAAVKGQSRSTLRNHLVEMQSLGFIDRKVERTRMPDGAIKTQVKIKELVDLSDPGLVWPSMHGGKRQRCKNCNSDLLVREVKVYCAACEAVQSQDVDLVNPPEEAAAERPFDAATVEHDATSLSTAITGTETSDVQVAPESDAGDHVQPTVYQDATRCEPQRQTRPRLNRFVALEQIQSQQRKTAGT